MRQSPRSPEDDALAQIEKIIRPLAPEAVAAFKRRVDDVFMRSGSVDQPRTSEQIGDKTRIADLFTDEHADPVTKAALTRARTVLQRFFDPQTHARLRDHNFAFRPNPDLMVGNVMSFRVIKRRDNFWYSQDKNTGKSQGADGLSDKTFALINERLAKVGTQLEFIEDKKFKPVFYWT